MVLSLVGVFGGFRSSVCSVASLVGAGGPAPCRLALPDRVCIRPSLCLKRVPRFKQKRPACGGFQYCQRGGWYSLVGAFGGFRSSGRVVPPLAAWRSPTVFLSALLSARSACRASSKSDPPAAEFQWCQWSGCVKMQILITTSEVRQNGCYDTSPKATRLRRNFSGANGAYPTR